MAAEPNGHKAITELGASSTRNRHATLNDVIVVQTYEPGFLLAVEEARATQQPIEIKLMGYGKEDIATACIWYALDQGVKVSITTTAIGARVALKGNSI